jgi:hypothetical protein
MTPDFWISSGHHLVDRRDDGRLLITDEFLKLYLARPEVAPVPESCPAERALHAELLAAPRMAVAAGRLAALADPDARENWSFFIRFRDKLLAARSIEAAYLDLARAPRIDLPPLFLDQLAHLVLRNALVRNSHTPILSLICVRTLGDNTIVLITFYVKPFLHLVKFEFLAVLKVLETLLRG